MNSIIKNKLIRQICPYNFTDNGRPIFRLNDVADDFNSFFVDIWPNLAKEIKHTGKTIEEIECNERKVDSMSLETVDRREIIDVVNSSTSKTSTDWNAIDMSQIK